MGLQVVGLQRLKDNQASINSSETCAWTLAECSIQVWFADTWGCKL
jgi:hypothetical protein